VEPSRSLKTSAFFYIKKKLIFVKKKHKMVNRKTMYLMGGATIGYAALKYFTQKGEEKKPINKGLLALGVSLLVVGRVIFE
jgi:hypothetical protein